LSPLPLYPSFLNIPLSCIFLRPSFLLSFLGTLGIRVREWSDGQFPPSPSYLPFFL
jgi:hypothetical protein